MKRVFLMKTALMFCESMFLKWTGRHCYPSDYGITLCRINESNASQILCSSLRYELHAFAFPPEELFKSICEFTEENISFYSSDLTAKKIPFFTNKIESSYCTFYINIISQHINIVSSEF